jgi:pimeloyl-ACP methyl ester carboxylesterase
MDLRERTIETNGVKLHVMEAGPVDGPMILFLHGFPDFWYGWRKQLGYFADRGYLVAAPDLRGYNLSEKPKGIAPYTMDEMAKDVVGLIDFYKRDQIFLVGHDVGASVSWWTCMKHPERIKRVVVMNSPHQRVGGKHIIGDRKQMEKSWYIFFFQLPGVAEAICGKDNCQWFIDVLAEDSRPGAFTPEELEKYREAFCQPHALTSMVNLYRAYLQAPSPPPADYRIKMPLLLLWGMNDTAFIPELPDECMAYCDNGRLVKFPESSHWLQHEEAEAINPLMDNFFKESSS